MAEDGDSELEVSQATQAGFGLVVILVNDRQLQIPGVVERVISEEDSTTGLPHEGAVPRSMSWCMDHLDTAHPIAVTELPVDADRLAAAPTEGKEQAGK